MPFFLENIIKKCFGSTYNPKSTYVIAIQGCSTSGKSTLALFLYTALKSSGCRPFVFNVDNFYKDLSVHKDIVNGTVQYDYDNPAAIHWDLLVNNFNSLLRNDKVIKQYTYNFSTKVRSETDMINDKGFNVLIVEGIFGHNIFNETIFNIKEYDCLDSSKQIDKPFIPNNFKQGNFHILKICLDLSNETIISLRRDVDAKREFKSPEESAKMVNSFVIPSTEKWVRPTSLNSSDLFLNKGTRDTCAVSKINQAITKFFGIDQNNNNFKVFLEQQEAASFIRNQ